MDCLKNASYLKKLGTAILNSLLVHFFPFPFSVRHLQGETWARPRYSQALFISLVRFHFLSVPTKEHCRLGLLWDICRDIRSRWESDIPPSTQVPERSLCPFLRQKTCFLRWKNYAHSLGPLNGPVSSGLASPIPTPILTGKLLARNKKMFWGGRSPRGTRRGGDWGGRERLRSREGKGAGGGFEDLEEGRGGWRWG